MKKLTFLLLILMYVSAYSQPTVDWEVTYGNPDFDRAYAMCESHQGGFILVGITENPDDTDDIWIVEYNDEGAVIGELKIGETQSEFAYDIKPTSDGGYIIAGKTDTYSSGNSDAYVIKIEYDDLGELKMDWSQTFGGPENDLATSVVEIEENDSYYYVVVGSEINETTGEPELLMLKLNPTDGTIAADLADNYNGAFISPVKMILMQDGYALGASPARIVKVNPDGTLQWDKLYNGSFSQTYDFDLTMDNGFIMTGVANGFPGNANYGLLKVDASGEMEWEKNYGGESVDLGFSVKQTSDGGYLVSGSLWSFGNYGDDEIGLIKTDPTGNVEWMHIEEDQGVEWGYTLMLLDDGGFIISGSNSELSTFDADFYLIRYDPLPMTSDFFILSNPACTGSDILFSPNFLASTAEYSWNFGDGNTSVLAQPKKSYSSPGIYTVSLSVNGIEAVQKTVFVKDIIADFSSSSKFARVGIPIDFIDKSICDPDSWSWGFEHGGTSTDANPIVTFSSAGQKDVSLTVMNAASASDTKDKTDYINVFCNSSGNQGVAWITSVSSGNTEVISGDEGFEDHTSTIFSMNTGGSQSINLTPGQPNGKPLKLDWRIWVDFDQNGIFDESPIELDNKKGQTSAIIEVPDDAIPGITLMRIGLYKDFPNNGNPCSTGFDGEVEDYSLQINSPAPLPPVAEFEGIPSVVQVGETVYFNDLSANNPDQWDWTITSDVIPTDIILTGPTPSCTFNTVGIYDVSLTVLNGIGSDSEFKPAYIEVIPANTGGGGYCPPELVDNSTANFCETVTIEGHAPFNNGQSGSGYVFYSDVTFNLTPGETYDVTLLPFWTRTRYFWRIWVDLNDDGDFLDANELLFEANNQKKAVSGTISIPDNADYENTRMRISMKKGSAQTGPCDDDFTGEVEDYNVTDPLKSFPLNSSVEKKINIKVYPNPVHDDRLSIELENISSQASLEIFNKYGAALDQFETSNTIINLNVSNYASGIYYVKIIHNGVVEVKKFIKR